MVKGFWSNLPRPIIGLAPMDGVTDAAFRYVVAKYGKPHLIFTEFTAAEGIRAGAERLLDDLYYSPLERPVVAQLFGADPEAFFQGAVVASALGFDGIDINMGCPAKNIAEKGAGAALILDPERAKTIIQKTRAGTKAWQEGLGLEEAGIKSNLIPLILKRRLDLGIQDEVRQELPVSLKTRIGYDHPAIKEWITHLLEVRPVAISIHGRTLKQLYAGLVDWEAIGQAVQLAKGSDTLILGNGDIASIPDAIEKIRSTQVDGILIGRASLGNPWIFQEKTVPFSQKMQVALEQSRLLSHLFNGRGFGRIRKHLLEYCKGEEGAKSLRLRLMKVNTVQEVESLLLH